MAPVACSRFCVVWCMLYVYVDVFCFIFFVLSFCSSFCLNVGALFYVLCCMLHVVCVGF